MMRRILYFLILTCYMQNRIWRCKHLIFGELATIVFITKFVRSTKLHRSMYMGAGRCFTLFSFNIVFDFIAINCFSLSEMTVSSLPKRKKICSWTIQAITAAYALRSALVSTHLVNLSCITRSHMFLFNDRGSGPPRSMVTIFHGSYEKWACTGFLFFLLLVACRASSIVVPVWRVFWRFLNDQLWVHHDFLLRFRVGDSCGRISSLPMLWLKSSCVR